MRRAGAERRRRRRGRRRGRGGARSPSSTSSYFQGPLARLGRAPTSAGCARVDPREPAARLRRARGDRDARRHRLGARAAPRLRPRHGHRARPRRGPAARRRRQQPDAPRRRHRRATAPTRPRASCSSATPSTCPILFLCDTPGHHGRARGREDRAGAPLRRMFVVGASLTVPFFTIVLRKGYGLGAQAMAGGSFKAPLFTRRVADRRVRRHGPRGRGEARLSARSSRRSRTRRSASALFEQMVAAPYEHGKALNTATHFEIDDVIDPADSRALDRRGAPRRPAAAAAHGQEAPLRRHLVTKEGI